MLMSLAFERQLVLVSVALLVAATLVQFAGLMSGRAVYRPTAAIYAGVVIVLGAAITGRWIRENQGPFLTLYDILLSGVFSLALMFLLISVLVPAVRGGSLVTNRFVAVQLNLFVNCSRMAGRFGFTQPHIEVPCPCVGGYGATVSESFGLLIKMSMTRH